MGRLKLKKKQYDMLDAYEVDSCIVKDAVTVRESDLMLYKPLTNGQHKSLDASKVKDLGPTEFKEGAKGLREECNKSVCNLESENDDSVDINKDALVDYATVSFEF